VINAAPSGLPRLLAGLPSGGAVGLDEHLDRLGPPPWRRSSGSDLIATVARSGLRGRGGAAFPVAEKMRAVASGSRRPVVVANGAEGEPASQKDQLLLEALPHLVIDGVAAAAAAIGARQALICVKRDAVAARHSVQAALRERAHAGSDSVELELVAVSGRYVAGEESALINSLNGGPAKPTFVPPRPFRRGVDGRPTLIQNVETLANLALIGRFGDDWYRELGTAEDPGTLLITLSGAVVSPGVYEVAGGSAVTALLEAAGGPTASLQAFLIGGYAGAWFAAASAHALRLGDAALRDAGGVLGPGVVIALPVGACAIAETARVLDYLADESAGQCGPCVHGLDAMAGAMEEIAAGVASPAASGRVARWSADIAGRGACRHPDGVLRLLASCLEVFAEEVERHEQGRPCSVDPAARDLLPLPPYVAAAAR
jgi:NADH:ubiquinone oxidoreductase subunit F (NADH-binding)